MGLLYLAGYAAATVVDLRSGRIPNAVTYPLLALSLIARPSAVGLVPLPNVIVAAAVALLFLVLVLRGWMGMGDVKLAVIIALASGPALAVIALWAAFLAGAIVGVGLLLTRRVGRGATVPFGPFLALGGALAVLAPGLLLDHSPFTALFDLR